jgi:hypothetical protein
MGEGAFVLTLPRCHRRAGEEDDGVGRGEVVRTGDLLGNLDQVVGRSEVAALCCDGRDANGDVCTLGTRRCPARQSGDCINDYGSVASPGHVG